MKTSKSKEKALQDFAEKFTSMQKDMPEEYQKIVNDYFWDML